jgi:hypothetical protein
VTWRYLVANTGTINLTGVVVVDDRGLSVNCISQTNLPAGLSKGGRAERVRERAFC